MCRTSQFHFTDPGLVGYEIYDYLTAAGIQRRREERKQREREKEAQKQREERQREVSVREKTEWRIGGHISVTLQAQEEAYDEHLMDSDEEALVGFVKDHEELDKKTKEHLKEKARNDCLRERFNNKNKLSVIVCKNWFESQMTSYSNSRSPSLARLQRK